MPKSTATKPSLGIDEQIARVHVGMEEAVAQSVTQKALDHLAAEVGQIVTGRDESGLIVQPRAVDPFEGEHITRSAIPIDRRNVEVGILAGVLPHLGERRRFEPEVHLDRD